jgi:hypothetical protein
MWAGANRRATALVERADLAEGLYLARKPHTPAAAAPCRRLRPIAPRFEFRSIAPDHLFAVRHLFNIASAVSLLLFIAVMSLWIRGFKVSDGFYLYGPRSFSFLTADGMISLISWEMPSTGSQPLKHHTFPPGYTTQFVQAYDQIGIHIAHTIWVHVPANAPAGLTPGMRIVRVPHWILAGVLIILPISFMYRFMTRSRRRDAMLCAKCDYNLTGNTSGVCPECGTPKTS